MVAVALGVEAVDVGQGAQPQRDMSRVAAGLERDETGGCVSQISEPGSRTGAIPVDEDPPVTVAHQVPRREVVVTAS